MCGAHLAPTPGLPLQDLTASECPRPAFPVLLVAWVFLLSRSVQLPCKPSAEFLISKISSSEDWKPRALSAYIRQLKYEMKENRVFANTNKWLISLWKHTRFMLLWQRSSRTASLPTPFRVLCVPVTVCVLRWPNVEPSHSVIHETRELCFHVDSYVLLTEGRKVYFVQREELQEGRKNAWLRAVLGCQCGPAVTFKIPQLVPVCQSSECLFFQGQLIRS